MRALQSAKTSLQAEVSTKTMALAGRLGQGTPDVDLDTDQTDRRYRAMVANQA